ncbi:hypothetical protein HOD71_01690 [Candidatus Peribacteria bacterium]|nr:hypothetical protein [Candidatus Peribacteria bacterium]
MNSLYERPIEEEQGPTNKIISIPELGELRSADKHLFRRLVGVAMERADIQIAGQFKIEEDGTVCIVPYNDGDIICISENFALQISKVINELYKKLVFRNPKNLISLLDEYDETSPVQTIQESMKELNDVVPDLGYSPFYFEGKPYGFYEVSEKAFDMLDIQSGASLTEEGFKEILRQASESTCHPDDFMLREVNSTHSDESVKSSNFDKMMAKVADDIRAFRTDYVKAMKGVKKPTLQFCYRTILELDNDENHSGCDAAISSVRDAITTEIMKVLPKLADHILESATSQELQVYNAYENPGLEAVRAKVEYYMSDVLNSDEEIIRYVRSDDDTQPDQFGVREMIPYSGDDPEYIGTTLICYARNGRHEQEILVRVQSANINGAMVNSIGQTANEFLQERVKFEHIPAIQGQIDRLEFDLSQLANGIPEQTNSDIVETAVKQLGIIRDNLIEAGPSTLQAMIEHLETLRDQQVVYLSLDNKKVLIERSIQHYRSQKVVA